VVDLLAVEHLLLCLFLWRVLGNKVVYEAAARLQSTHVLRAVLADLGHQTVQKQRLPFVL